ncbi:hypothetical protein DFH29DRAFT_881510, partial [Suillus ampliporus]
MESMVNSVKAMIRVEIFSGYYEKSADSDAYIMAMLLNPILKANHIHCYWGEELYQDALAHAKEIKCMVMVNLKPAEVKTIVRRELQAHEPYVATSTCISSLTYNPAKPWLQDFNAYLNSKDHL